MSFECVPETDLPWSQVSPGVDFQMRKKKKLGSKGPDGDRVRDFLGIESHCGEQQNVKLKDGARTEMLIVKITKRRNVHTF